MTRPRFRARAALAAAAVFVVAVPAAAPAANDVTVSGSTVHVRVPVEVRGALDGAEARNALARLALPLSTERLHGCFAVVPEFTEAVPPEAHTITVVPQRAGQFLRPSVSGGADPYSVSRDLIVGERSFEDDVPLGGPVALLLSPDPAGAGASTLSELVSSVIEETGVAERLQPCAWKGTLELSSTYEKFGLTVTATIPFTFTVTAAGELDGKVTKTTRSATADDPDVGHCEGEDIPMFKVGMTGRATPSGFELSFTAKGAEPGFKLECAGGSVDLGGDYLRTAFLPTGTVTLSLAQKPGASETTKNALQGRKATAKVTIRRD